MTQDEGRADGMAPLHSAAPFDVGLVDNIPACISYIDRDGVFRFVNKTYEAWFGRSREEIVGRTFREIVGEDSYEDVRNHIEKGLRGEYVDYERTISGNGGPNRHILVNLVPDMMSTREVRGLYVLANDVTEQRESERLLRRAVETEKRQNQVLSAFVGGARKLLETDNFEISARRIFDSCREITGAASGYVALLSEDGTENEVLFLESGGLECTVDTSLPMPIRGLREGAYRTGEAVFSNRFSESEWMEFMPEGHVDLKNVLFVPMKIEGRAVGLIGLANKAGDFTREDALLVEGFGELASLGLKSCRRKEALRESEERFRRLFASAREGIALHEIVCDESGRAVDYLIVDVNDSYSVHTGIARSAAVGRRASELYGTAQPPYLDIFAEVASSGKPTFFETYFPPMKKYFRISIFAPAEGQFATVFDDITERLEYEKRIERSNDFLQSVLDSITDPLYVINVKDFTIEMANEAAYPGELPKGVTCHALTHREEQPCALKGEPCPLEMVRATGKPATVEHVHYDAEGGLRSHEVQGHPVFDEAGEVVQVIEFSRDVTLRKHLEEQVQRSQRMDSLGTLAGGLAHDFNNLLTGIMGNLDLLRIDGPLLTEVQKEYIEGALQSTRRAITLSGQIQSLARGSVSRKTSIDLHDAIAEVFSVLQKTTDRMIEKRNEVEKGSLFVTADPGELNQVLLNLGTNAVHAILEKGCRSGDHVTVKAEVHRGGVPGRGEFEEAEYIHLRFSDSGCGMKDEVRKKAFDPLFTTKDKGPSKGTGLGLAMVYNIVTRKSAGFVDIESTVGKGTVVHLWLPKASSGRSREMEVKEPSAGGGETVLVIDDDQSIVRLARKILERQGYAVLCASDGEEGIEMFNENKDSIDVVLLDLTMPKVPGKTVFEKMLEISPDVKVVISTGQSEEQSHEGVLSRAKGFLKKPYEVWDMTESIRDALDG